MTKQKPLISIAVAERYGMYRAALSHIIPTLGNYEVAHTAGTAKELLGKFNKAKSLPVLCIVDVDLPDNGFQLVREIKTHWPNVKILVFSACDTSYAVTRAIANGASGYIRKNADPTEFKKALQDILTKGYHYSKLATEELFEGILYKRIPVPKVSAKHVRFLNLCAQGMTHVDIAETMGQSPRTIDSYRDYLVKKFNLKNKAALIAYVLRSGIISHD